MDNCLLSDSKNLPLWYVKILSYFPNFRTYNNFYNDSTYNLYQLIRPKYGFYSLRSIYDIFSYHPILNTQAIKVIKYEFNIITIFEYNSKTGIFDVIKTLDNSVKLDEDLINLINTIFTNDPKIILSEQLLIGLLYALKISELYYPNLYDKLLDVNINLCLKKYKTSQNYDFIYHAFQELLFKYKISEETVRKKKNEYLVQFNLPESIILSNLVGGNLTIQEFKNGKVKSNKNEITYNSIILCILISRYCKKSNFNRKPFDIEFIIKIFLDEFDSFMKEDIIMMIKILEIEKVLFKENDKFYITSNFEDKVHKFFINSSFWWSINVDKSFKQQFISTDNSQNAKFIFDEFSSLENDDSVKILCHSGCDKTFIEEASKLKESLIFIQSLSSVFSSNNYSYSNYLVATDVKYLKDVNLLYDIPIKIYLNNNKPSIDIGPYKNLILTSIFSNQTIVNKYNPSENLILDYNVTKLKFKLIELLKIDLAHYLIYIKDCKINNYLLYTSDINLKLLCHLYGSNFVFERVKNGKRLFELYESKSSDFKL